MQEGYGLQLDEETSDYPLPYATTNRGTFKDLMSALFRGTASTTESVGRGLKQLGADEFGQAIQDTATDWQQEEFAKPDPSEYFGTRKSRIKDIAMGVAEGAPQVLGSIGSGIAGTIVGGPAVGISTGLGFMGLTAGAGAYNKSFEEITKTYPDMPEEDRHEFAFNDAAYEFAGEVVGTGIGFGAGKLLGGTMSKGMIKAGLKNMVEGGEVSAAQVMAASLGKSSKADLAKAIGIGFGAEGTSEVATQLMQEANREAYGLEENPVDLFNLFVSSAILGGGIGGVSAYSGWKEINSMKKSITEGLSSEDEDRRAYVVDSLEERLNRVDPEASQAFLQTIGIAASKGPVDIEKVFKLEMESPGLGMQELVTPAWEVTAREIQSQRNINQITTDPGSILKEAGIPTGVASSSNPYGGTDTGVITPPVVPPYNPAREVPASTTPGTASFNQPISPYAIEQGMAQVTPSTNQVVGKSIDPDSNNVVDTPIAKDASVKPIAPVAKQEVISKPLEKEKIVDNPDAIYTKDDLKGITILQPTGKTTSNGKPVFKKVDAYQAHSVVEEEIDLYEDIQRCAKK